MVTLEQAAQTLGMSPRQLRRRVEATAPLLAPLIGRGEKNRLLLDFGAVEALRAVEARRVSGQTLREAIAAVSEEMRGGHPSEQGRAEGRTASAPSVASALVDELRARVVSLERENDRLWSLVSDLKQALPALPAPRPARRRWWPWARASRS
jgi:hypothetical protein